MHAACIHILPDSPPKKKTAPDHRANAIHLLRLSTSFTRNDSSDFTLIILWPNSYISFFEFYLSIGTETITSFVHVHHDSFLLMIETITSVYPMIKWTPPPQKNGVVKKTNSSSTYCSSILHYDTRTLHFAPPYPCRT